MSDMFERRYPNLVHPNASKYWPGSHSPRNKRDSWHNFLQEILIFSINLSFCFLFCEKIKGPLAEWGPETRSCVLLTWSADVRGHVTPRAKMAGKRKLAKNSEEMGFSSIFIAALVAWEFFTLHYRWDCYFA